MLDSPKQFKISLFLLIFLFRSVNSLCVEGYDACSTCLNSTHCSTCYPLHGLNSQGYCVRCTDANCKSCPGDNPSGCSACLDYYELSIFSSCVKSEICDQTDCIHCPNSTAQCEQCDYFIPFNGLDNETCTNCSVANCKWCKQNATTCQYCNYGYGQNIINNTLYCSLCSDYHTNCAACWSNILYCTICENHYGVNLTTPNGQCVLCRTSNCQVCGRDYNLCTECMTSYGLNQTGCYFCNQSISFCLTCDPQLLIKCSSCPPQRYLDNNICRCYPSNCYLCSNNSACDECVAGYYRKADGLCQVCPPNCAYCFFNAVYSSPECTQCVSNLFELDQSLPPVCQQICGDNYNTVYPCENSISMLYDGCDENCQIEENFTCTLLNTSNLTDKCKYSGIIQLKYIGFTKQQFSNVITLKFTIFPPLYAFTITPQDDLIKMLELSNKNFSVKNILINQLTCQLIFLCDLIGDVFSDQIVYVQFNPSRGSTSNYFLTNATTLSEFQFSYTIYYYQEIVFTFSKLLLYICYVLSVLGWISSLLGLVLRKLAGLEAMMVIQFSWIAILTLDAPLLLPFRQVYPLIYSNGYNHYFSQFDSQISRQSPYTSYFHLSRMLLYDNWNINLLFISLAFIILVASTIRVKRFISRYSSEIKQSDERSDELEKLMEQNGKTCEWLMYVCMFNLTYFVCVSLLFFKFGNITNMLSLILFSAGAFILLFTFIRFTLDPYPFGYFRFSFSNKCLAMQHYCLVIVMTTSSVVIVFLFSHHTYIALVPSFLFLLYTLIYRPYKYLKDNLRYSFNLLTICSFISLRVYVELTPSHALNTIPTYVFLVLNVCFLLPCSVIFGIVYTIHGYCQEKFMMQQEQAYRETENGKKQWMRRNILKQLVSIQNYNNKIGDVSQKTVFKDLIDPNTSLVEASSLLKNGNKNATTDRPFIVEEAVENTKNKYKQYKKLIRKDQIDLMKNIKEKKGENLDKLVFQKFEYEQGHDKFNESKRRQKLQKENKNEDKDEKAQQKKRLNIEITEDILLAENRFIQFKAIEENVKKQKEKNADASYNILMKEYENIQNINIL